MSVGNSLQNTGTGTGCVLVQDIALIPILVSTFKRDGSFNEIDFNSETIDPAFILAKINNPDKFERWFPLPAISNVVDAREESTFETSAENEDFRVQLGKRAAEFQLMKEGNDPAFYGKVRSFQCPTMSIYWVDVCSSLIGYSIVIKKLRPLPIARNTLDVRWMAPTGSTVPKNMIKFNYDRKLDDATIRVESAASFPTVDLTVITGLLDITLIETPAVAPTLTSVSVDATAPIGNFSTPDAAEGFDQVTDWDLFNTNTPAAVTVLTVTETLVVVSPTESVVSYLLTFVAQPTTNIIRIKTSKDGFETPTPITQTMP